jgi:hypothetical protein
MHTTWRQMERGACLSPAGLEPRSARVDGAGTAAPCAQAQSIGTLKMMIPASPDGGWDQTGRALGAAMQSAKLVQSVQFAAQDDRRPGRGLQGRPRQGVVARAGRRGGSDHILAGLTPRAVGVEPTKVTTSRRSAAATTRRIRLLSAGSRRVCWRRSH